MTEEIAKLRPFRAGVRLASGRTLLMRPLGFCLADVRRRVALAMQDIGQPPATLLVCIAGSSA